MILQESNAQSAMPHLRFPFGSARQTGGSRQGQAEAASRAPGRFASLARTCANALATADRRTHAAWSLLETPERIAGLEMIAIEAPPVPVARKPATVFSAPQRLVEEFAVRTSTPILAPQSAVAMLRHATTIGGIVLDRDGRVLRESLINRSPGETVGAARYTEAGALVRPRLSLGLRRLRGHPYVLLKQNWDENYGHWLMEALPRIAVVAKHFALSDCRFIVSAHHGDAMDGVYRDSLAFFGIRPDQIVAAGDEPLAVETLVYPTPVSCHAWTYSPLSTQILQTLAAAVPEDAAAPRRIYVTRRGAGRRHLVNESELLPILAERGFEIVGPETMTLRQQIAAFRRAKIVVGNYGAALTNVAFASGDVTLFALTSEFMQDDFFSTLMSLRSGRYVSLHGKAADPAQGMNADFTIDPARFADLLKSLVP